MNQSKDLSAGAGETCPLCTHDLYKDGDDSIPEVIQDRNGQVVLGLCKKCGLAEIELSQPCIPKREAQPLPAALDAEGKPFPPACDVCGQWMFRKEVQERHKAQLSLLTSYVKGVELPARPSPRFISGSATRDEVLLDRAGWIDYARKLEAQLSGVELISANRLKDE